MMRAFVAGIAVWGPGLPGWAAARPVLAGEAAYENTAAPLPVPAILPANERRRTGASVRLALAAMEQAVDHAGVAPEDLASVFATSNGDGAVVHAILETLAGEDRQVSPTQFHNSVHNAAAGYWTIATGCHAAATSLGCHDATFPAALLKAMAELATEGRPVALCAYDAPLPHPLSAKRPDMPAFAAALVLTATPGAANLGEIGLRYHATPAASTLPADPALHRLFAANPAAQALPLLEALATGARRDLVLAYLDGHLAMTVAP